MIYAKTTSYGLDIEIKKLQTQINSVLASYWSGTIHVYGLMERTETENGTIPEVWVVGATKKYLDVFVNGKVTATIGFIEQGERTLGERKVANIDAICTMRLDKAFGNTARDSELALIQFEIALNSFFGRRQVQSAKIGIEEVFSGFYFDNKRHRDMQPWFVFSMNLDIPYYQDSRCFSTSVLP